jgi:uncharacterized protein (TIRG00374 family)
MDSPKPKLTWKTLLFPLLGLASFFLYIYALQVDIRAILETAMSANAVIYALAIGCGFLEIFFFAVSWQSLTKRLDIKMSVKKAYLYVWYSLYVDILVPAESVSGEVVRTYLLTRDKCGSFGKIVASLFTHRLLGMAMNAAVLVLGIVLLYFEVQLAPEVFNIIVFMAVAISAATIGAAYLSFKKPLMIKVVNFASKIISKLSFGKWKPGNLTTQTLEFADNFHNSMLQFRQNKKPLIQSLFYLCLTWLFSLGVPYLVFLSLGTPVSWSIILVTAGIVLAVKSIPVGIPFEVGLPEAAMTTLYFSMGITVEVAATATILTRIITLWLRFLAGFIAQQYIELKPIIASECIDRKN